MIANNKIVVTGGSGRFASSLKRIKCKYNFIYPKKNELDITKINTIVRYLKKERPKYLLHLAGLSRPMIQHKKDIKKSINLNIIGTANLVSICSNLNIKLIYFSTSYVYQGTRGNYNEIDPVLPWNNYAWSKLGGECSVQMYNNSLILRVCMTEKPFIHKTAFANVKLNFIFHEDLAKIIIKVLHKKGIINVGGKTRTVYNFAKEYNPKVKKSYINNKSTNAFPLKPYMDLHKLNKIIK